METIMSVMINESDAISQELLKVLLESIRKENRVGLALMYLIVPVLFLTYNYSKYLINVTDFLSGYLTRVLETGCQNN